MEQSNEILITQIKCKIHPKFDLLFLNIQSQQENPIYCAVCMLKQQFKNTFLSIQDILQAEQTQPIQNWPLGITENQLSFLNNNPQYSIKDQIEEKINSFYKELQSQVLETIEKSKKKAFNDLQQINVEFDDIIDFYNQKFKRINLQQLFNSPNGFQQNMFKKLVEEVEQQKQQHLQELNKKMDLHKNIDNYVRYEQSQEIKLIINQLISSIHFFDQSLLVQKSQNIFQDQIDKQNNDINQENFNHQNIVDLITMGIDKNCRIKKIVLEDNPHLQANYQYNSEFLGQELLEFDKIFLKIRLSYYESFFNLLNKHNEIEINKQFEINADCEYKDIYELLEQQQNSIIQQCQSQYEKQDQNSENCKQIKEFIKQSNSYLQYLCNLQKEINNQKSKNQNQIQNLSDIQNQVSQIKDILLRQTNKLSFQKSNYVSSKLLHLSYDDFGYCIMKNNDQDIVGHVFSSLVLIKNKTYILRFKLNLPFYQMEQFAIGLVLYNKRDQTIRDSQQYLKNNHTDYTNMVKGTMFQNAQNKDNILEIEMRVNIEMGIIQYSEFPSYQNVYQNKFNILRDQDYRFMIFLCGQMTKIIKLTYYEEASDWKSFN